MVRLFPLTMASKGKDKAKPAPKLTPRGARPRPFWGVLCLIFALLTLVAFVDYSPDQLPQHFNTRSAETNLVGAFGVNIVYWSYLVVGLAAWCIPAFSFWMSYLCFRGQAYVLNIPKIASMPTFAVCMSVFASILEREQWRDFDGNTFPSGLGGTFGSHLYHGFLESLLGMVGSLVVFGVFTIFLSFNLFYDNVFKDLGSSSFKGIANWWNAMEARSQQRRKERREAKAKAKKEKAKERGKIKELRNQLAEEKKKLKASTKQQAAAATRTEQPSQKPANNGGFSPLADDALEKLQSKTAKKKAAALKEEETPAEEPAEEKRGLFGRKKKPAAEKPAPEPEPETPKQETSTPFTPFVEGPEGSSMSEDALDPERALNVLDEPDLPDEPIFEDPEPEARPAPRQPRPT
ncbi:MAG: hypothetical protein E1N59_2083, partial [Puniceicoccaceae bacterium 5H]